jgi:MFS family permease
MTIDPVHYARRWKTLAVLALSLVIIGLDNTILNVALPSLQREFDASSSTLQWMVDAYLLVYAGLILTMGTLGDRFGRKLALQTGLALFGGGSLAVLAVGTSGQLIAVRAVMGVGGALIMPATLSIISNVFPLEERQKAIGIWAGMASIGIGLGPLFGGLLLEYFDWQSVFMVNVPIAAVAFALGMRLVPESRDPKPGAFDLVGAGLSVAALLALVFPIIEAPEWGWTDTRVLACFAAAAVLGLAFARWELRTPEPMLNLSFLRSPRFSVASFAISLASFALFGAIFANTQFLQDAMGYSALPPGRRGDDAARARARHRRRVGHEGRRAARHDPRRRDRPPRPGRPARLEPGVDAGHALRAARRLVLRDRLRHGLDPRPGDRVGDGLDPRVQGRRRLGDERRHAAGRRGARHRGDRLARQLAVRLEGR